MKNHDIENHPFLTEEGKKMAQALYERGLAKLHEYWSFAMPSSVVVMKAKNYCNSYGWTNSSHITYFNGEPDLVLVGETTKKVVDERKDEDGWQVWQDIEEVVLSDFAVVYDREYDKMFIMLPDDKKYWTTAPTQPSSQSQNVERVAPPISFEDEEDEEVAELILSEEV